MLTFSRAVKRGAKNTFVVADMPFGTYATQSEGIRNAVKLFQKSGVEAVKLEGAFAGHLELIRRLTETGIPVMGHIGLTPQSVHQQAGTICTGKNEQSASLLVDNALALEKAGAFAIVLECVTPALAKKITSLIGIPTIGIGSGKDTDGQVLVLNDLLGMAPDAVPRFVKPVAQLYETKKQLRNRLFEKTKTNKFSCSHSNLFPMTTILTIDNGNTSPSVGSFDSTGCLSHIDSLSSFILSHDIHQYPTFMADVGREIPELTGHPRLTRVGDLRTGNTFLDMPVHYASSLGEDRLACAWKIYQENHERSILIDAGTCVTVDLIDANGFQGGYILPGIQAYLDAYRAGAALPWISNKEWNNSFGNIPQDTPESILSSCQHYLQGTLKNILSSSGLPINCTSPEEPSYKFFPLSKTLSLLTRPCITDPIYFTKHCLNFMPE